MFKTDLENLIAGYMFILSIFALIGAWTTFKWVLGFVYGN